MNRQLTSEERFDINNAELNIKITELLNSHVLKIAFGRQAELVIKTLFEFYRVAKSGNSTAFIRHINLVIENLNNTKINRESLNLSSDTNINEAIEILKAISSLVKENIELFQKDL